MTEFELIGKIAEMFPAPDGFTGIGDDCAVIPCDSDSDLLVSTDMLLDGVHFLSERMPAVDIGWKSAAVNLSDIAACGGEPVGTFLSVALPANLPAGWIENFMQGYREISELYKAPLLGGDTCSSKSGICINVTVIGKCGHGKAVLRSGARPGDIICVTGKLGDSGAGLKMIQEGFKTGSGRALVNKHFRPVPRIAEGIALSHRGAAGAMMDISDGLSSDLRHILKASGCGAVVEVSKLPLSAELMDACTEFGWDAVELALCGGEDYELLFTLRSGADAPVPCTEIGRITEGNELLWLGSEREYSGFRHF